MSKTKADFDAAAKQLCESVSEIAIGDLKLRRLEDGEENVFEIVNVKTTKKLRLSDEQFWRLQDIANAIDSSVADG